MDMNGQEEPVFGILAGVFEETGENAYHEFLGYDTVSNAVLEGSEYLHDVYANSPDKRVTGTWTSRHINRSQPGLPEKQVASFQALNRALIDSDITDATVVTRTLRKYENFLVRSILDEQPVCVWWVGSSTRTGERYYKMITGMTVAGVPVVGEVTYYLTNDWIPNDSGKSAADWRNTSLHLRQAEVGVFGGDNEIAIDNEFTSASHRQTIDCCNDWLFAQPCLLTFGLLARLRKRGRLSLFACRVLRLWHQARRRRRSAALPWSLVRLCSLALFFHHCSLADHVGFPSQTGSPTLTRSWTRRTSRSSSLAPR